MEKLEMLCEVGGIDGHFKINQRYPAEEVLANHWERLDADHIIVWRPNVHGLELMAVDELMGVFEYGIFEA